MCEHGGDFQFLRTSLQADKDDREAEKYFNDQFDYALSNKWMAFMNNLAHQARMRINQLSKLDRA